MMSGLLPPLSSRTSTMSHPTCCCSVSLDRCDRCDLLVDLEGFHLVAVARRECGLVLDIESCDRCAGRSILVAGWTFTRTSPGHRPSIRVLHCRTCGGRRRSRSTSAGKILRTHRRSSGRAASFEWLSFWLRAWHLTCYRCCPRCGGGVRVAAGLG